MLVLAGIAIAKVDPALDRFGQAIERPCDAAGELAFAEFPHRAVRIVERLGDLDGNVPLHGEILGRNLSRDRVDLGKELPLINRPHIAHDIEIDAMSHHAEGRRHADLKARARRDLAGGARGGEERVGFARCREIAERSKIDRVWILARRRAIALVRHVEIARRPARDHAGGSADDRRLRPQPAALLFAVGQALGERTERCAGEFEDLPRLKRYAADQVDQSLCHARQDTGTGLLWH